MDRLPVRFWTDAVRRLFFFSARLDGGAPPHSCINGPYWGLSPVEGCRMMEQANQVVRQLRAHIGQRASNIGWDRPAGWDWAWCAGVLAAARDRAALASRAVRRLLPDGTLSKPMFAVRCWGCIAMPGGLYRAVAISAAGAGSLELRPTGPQRWSGWGGGHRGRLWRSAAIYWAADCCSTASAGDSRPLLAALVVPLVSAVSLIARFRRRTLITRRRWCALRCWPRRC